MRHALAAQSKRDLAEFIAKEGVLVFDYDGTLAPIVDDPERAFLPERTRELLAALTERAKCVLLTGRELKQVRRFMPSINFTVSIGNHGAEWSTQARRFQKFPDGMREKVIAAVRTTKGAVIEEKVYSLSVHTREIHSQADRDVLSARIAAIPGVKIVPGKRVLNVLTEDAPDKGKALCALHADLGKPRILFFGDDVTDEYVFSLEKPWLLGVRVQKHPASKAPFYLNTQAEMNDLLEWLVHRYDSPRLPNPSI
jgi:trehalose 6-phosphate phosphatase